MAQTVSAMVLAIGLAAHASMQNATPADEQRANGYYRQGWELLARESWAEAAKAFQAAIDVDRRFKLAYYGLGRADMALKRFPQAITAYEQCRDLFVAQASQNLSNRAEAERMVKDDAMQLDTAIQRLAGGPQTTQTQVRITELQQQKQRYRMSLKGTEDLSLVTPVPPFVSLALGSAYFRSERMSDAEHAYQAALEVDPKSGEAHSNLAVVYLTTGRYDEAEKEVKAAEKVGFKVNPDLKDDIAAKKKG